MSRAGRSDNPPPTPRRWLANHLTLRPGVAVSAAMMLGIAVHAFLPHHPAFWLLATLAAASAAWLWMPLAGRSTVALLLATAFAGVALAQVESFRFRRDHVAHFARADQRVAQLELYINRPPRVIGDPFSVGRALPPKQVCVARVTGVKTWAGWQPATGDVLVQIDQPHPRLAAHQTVRVLGMLQRPSPAMNPGQFDWEEYYREQRVLASVGIDHADNIQILSQDAPSPLTRLREQARRLLALGFPAERSLDHALLRALLLGDHDPELRDVQDQFRRTGTSHHLAISGLHIAVLGGVVLAACRALRLGPRPSAWIALAFVVVYGVAALPSPPVVRSVLMCAAFTVGVLGRRTVDALQMLSISVIAMLVYHPLDLFNAGFQLSFGTVLGLILFTPPVARWLLRDDPDFAVLRSFRKLTPRQQAWDAARRFGLKTLAAAGVAWAVSAPVVALHFEQLNPWAIAGSVILAPFVFVALVGGLMKVLLTAMLPAAAPAWAELSSLPMEAMRDVVDALAKLPGADVPLPAPPVWAVVAFYVALALPLLPFTSAIARRGLAAVATAGGALAMILPFVGGFRAPDPVRPVVDEVSLTVLAVGAGQCVVIAPPRGPLVLVDCGSNSLRDPLRRCVAPFVRRLGRWSVGRIILSHGDYDHISAVADVAAAYGVDEVITGPHFRRLADGNPPAERLLEFFEQTDRGVLELVPGNRLSLGGGATLEVLWPPPGDESLSSNDSGLVLRLAYAGRSVLLPADVQVAAQRALLADPKARPALRADVLVAPHHGSVEESTADFVQAVDPLYVLSSDDRTPTLKQVEFEPVAGPGRRLLRTNRDGSLTVRITRRGELSVHAYHER